eukprot:11387789-Alexandrium_andersonii.AAC.1
MVLDRCNRRLIQKVRELLSICHRQFHLHGLRLNYAKGKTEVTLTCRGPHSKSVLAAVAKADGIDFDAGGEVVVVTVSRQYKHLGCYSDLALRMLPETRSKAQKGGVILKTISRRVLSAGPFSVATKNYFVQTLMESA